jgi:predicted secreted hydrolase
MRRAFLPILILVATVLGAAALLWWSRPPSPEPDPERLTVAETLGGEALEGYARAMEPRTFRFPEDHGPHPEFRTEWWYFTGNLHDERGRHFGYQLTFFRVALAPEAPERSSDWASRHVFMAHFALTDTATGRFHHFERFSRVALGLAGARTTPFRVWLEEWSVASEPGEGFPWRLQAGEGGVEIDFLLERAKPIVLQGDAGLSQKSDEPGNASYYYSMTRLPTRGTIRIGEGEFFVEGDSWLDREWSTSALGEGDVGWDWFSLQLSDYREVMFYRIRREGGESSPWSAGTVVSPDGSARSISVEEVHIEELARWRSPRSGAVYPALWRLSVPSEGIDLLIEPQLADQELETTVRYWEGAVRAQGTSRGEAVTGMGYVEMTGY